MTFRLRVVTLRIFISCWFCSALFRPCWKGFFKGGFRTFPRVEKSARSAGRLSARVAAHWSSWTPAACEGKEPLSSLKSKSEEEDPDLWVDEYGRRWYRSYLYPEKWGLGFTGKDVDIYWEEPGWGSLGPWVVTWSADGNLWLKMPSGRWVSERAGEYMTSVEGFLGHDMGCGCFLLVAGRRAWCWRVRLSGPPSYSASRAAACGG